MKVPTVEDIKLTIDFTFKPNRLLNLETKGMLGKKTISLVAKVDVTTTKIEAMLAFATPKNPEGMSAKLLLSDPNQGKNLDATITLTLSPEKIIKLVTYLKKEEWTQAEGKLELTSFFADKVAADFGWHINFAEKSSKFNFALEYLPGKKITIDWDMLRKETEFTLNYKVMTPIDPLRLFRYHIKSVGELNNQNTHVEGQVNEMIVSTDLITKINSWMDFEVTLTTNAPIRNFEKTSITVSNKAEEKKPIKVMASLLLKGKTWSIEAVQQGLELNQIENILTISMPIANWEKTILYMSNKGNPTDMLTKLSLTLNNKVWMVELTTKFVELKNMFFGLTITTPLKNLEKTTVEMTHTGMWENMVSKIAVKTMMNSETPVELEISAKILAIANMEVKMSLKGLKTFVNVEPITVSITNRGQAMKPLVTILSVTVGPKVYALNSNLNFEGIENMEGSIILTTPFEKYERVGLRWTNKVVEGKQGAKLDIEFQTEQLVTIEGHILMKGLKTEARLTVTTPFAAFDKAYFALDFTGTLTDFEGVVIVELPKVRKTEVHFSNKLDLANGISHKAMLRIDCIFFSTTAIETSFELKELKDLKFTAKFGYGLKKGEYTLNAKLIKAEGITFEMDSTLVSDWTKTKSAALTFTLFLNETKVKLTTMIKLNEVELLAIGTELFSNLKGTLTLKQKLVKELPEAWEMTGELKLTMPSSLIKMAVTADTTPLASFEFTHTYTQEALTSKIVAAYKVVKMESNLLISKPKETILLKVDAMKNDAKIVDVETSYEVLPEKIHAVKLKAIYEGKTLVDVLFKFKPDVRDAAIEVRESGRSIFGLKGKFLEHTLVAHIAWLDAPLVDFETAYEVLPEMIHVAKVKTIFKGKSLVDVILRFKPDINDAAIEVQEGERTIFGLKGKLIEHTLEAHLVWLDAPIVDLKTELKRTPLTIAILLNFKGQEILNTQVSFGLENNVLEAHIMWNNSPLVDAKIEAQSAARAYTFGMEVKYLGKDLLITKNTIDLEGKKLKAMLNIDPILELIMENPESCVLSLEGGLEMRRDLSVWTLDAKKGKQLLYFKWLLNLQAKLI
jgi:hypothetical protein